MARVQLLPGEEEVFRTRPHAATVWGPIVIVGLLALPAAVALKSLSAVIGAVVLLLYVAFVWYVFANRAASAVVVTDRRVIARSGVISRCVVDLNLSKIENSAVGQSIFGRVLGYGTVVVTGTGGTRETFDAIEDADTLHAAIHMAREHAAQVEAKPRAGSTQQVQEDAELVEEKPTRITVETRDGQMKTYRLDTTDPVQLDKARAKIAARGERILREAQA